MTGSAFVIGFQTCEQICLGVSDFAYSTVYSEKSKGVNGLSVTWPSLMKNILIRLKNLAIQAKSFEPY